MRALTGTEIHQTQGGCAIGAVAGLVVGEAIGLSAGFAITLCLEIIYSRSISLWIPHTIGLVGATAGAIAGWIIMGNVCAEMENSRMK